MLASLVLAFSKMLNLCAIGAMNESEPLHTFCHFPALFPIDRLCRIRGLLLNDEAWGEPHQIEAARHLRGGWKNSASILVIIGNACPPFSLRIAEA